MPIERDASRSTTNGGLNSRSSTRIRAGPRSKSASDPHTPQRNAVSTLKFWRLQMRQHGGGDVRARRPMATAAGGVVKSKTCCAGQDIYDASQVAAKRGFPHYVLNYESNFRESVIEDFADSYLRGETPIPCVRCNQTVKFHDLLATARDPSARRREAT